MARATVSARTIKNKTDPPPPYRPRDNDNCRGTVGVVPYEARGDVNDACVRHVFSYPCAFLFAPAVVRPACATRTKER